MPLAFRAVNDTQFSGAFIVDPPGADPESDRVFVITDWTSLTLAELREIAAAPDPGVAFLAVNPRFTFLMNGLSWPHTERLTARLGEPVRWRVLNLSTQTHTMHLHGMFMHLENGAGEYLPRKHTVLVKPAERLSVAITPDERGPFAFHCHLIMHMEMGMFRVVLVDGGPAVTA